MLKSIIPILVIVIFGCSEPDSMKIGEAIVTIDNVEYKAKATVGSRTLEDTEFEKISIVISDTLFFEILKEIFIEETIKWTSMTPNTDGVVFSLQCWGVGGALYGPGEGFLKISNRSNSAIAGEFELDVYDFASSCWQCPDDKLTVEGQFIARVD